VLFSDIRSFEKRYALEAEGAAPRVPAGDEGLLEEMLKDGKQRKQLRKTAKSQHCEELLAFVDAFMELKYHSTDAEDRLILAERLFTRFLRVGCSKGEEGSLLHMSYLRCQRLTCRTRCGCRWRRWGQSCSAV
jgi:hypothetical protein